MPALFSGPVRGAASSSSPVPPSMYRPSAQTKRPPGQLVQGREAYSVLFVCLLDAGASQVLKDDLPEVVSRTVDAPGFGETPSMTSPFSSTPRTRWGEMLSTVKGPATRTLLRSSYGLSYRYSKSVLAAIDASISLCRAIRSSHHRAWRAATS